MLALCFQSLLLVAMWLYLIYRKQAFSGLFAAVIMFQTISLYLMRGYWIVLPVGMAISVLTEAAFTWLQPSLQRPGALRLFAGCAAASFPLAYIIGLALSGPFLWSAHLAGGSVVVSGVLGYLMACMATPPPTRQQMVNEQPEYYRKEQIDATCCSDTAARDGVAGSTAGH